MSWNANWSLATNQNAKTLLEHPSVSNREDLAASSADLLDPDDNSWTHPTADCWKSAEAWKRPCNGVCLDLHSLMNQPVNANWHLPTEALCEIRNTEDDS